MTLWKNALIGLAASVFVSLLYTMGAFNTLEDRLYDYFLGFRIDRPLIESVVFLDVDDNAIAYNGMYPWPRSIPANGLLRLKEYGAKAVIFDIEYIDHGPQGVDSLYLDRGLGDDFSRSFSEINTNVKDMLSSVREGRMGQADFDYYSGNLFGMIDDEREALYNKARTVARDNDQYLAQALALFGRSWATLNLRDKILRDEEQSSRRPIAEELFSYPVIALEGAHRGSITADILPPLPIFALAVKGAGFTNIEIDDDGIRRRIYLTQNIYDHWYLQLAFAPLIDYLGKPELVLENRKLTIKQAQMTDGQIKDIVIPLDSKGRMMLDWPKTDYEDTFNHISFWDFSFLDEIEVELEKYSRALASADLMFFARFDPSLMRIPFILGDIEEFLDAAYEAKDHALENLSDDSFDAFIRYRNQGYALLAEIFGMDAETKIRTICSQLSADFPEDAAIIEDEAEYIAMLVNNLNIDLKKWHELTESNRLALQDKFCIIGRVDTGTTDYGVNPFWGKYVNAGTHGIVLDTILSGSFITPLSEWWHLLIMLLFVPLFSLVSARLSLVVRAATGFGVTIFIVIISILMFRYTGVFLGPLGTVFSMLICVIVREIYSYADSEKEKSFIRTAFSTYVSGDVVKEIIANPSHLHLGGTKRHMTAIFTDIMNFSRIAEQLDPEELVSLLNRYLSAMSDVILAEKGTIDKYDGDAIIAFFGAPLDLADHALRACVSAITMKRIEAELNKTIMEQKLSPLPLFTRIGINTGSMVAGNMGTDNKMNYTIMGNAVNLASRLEGVNKQYGTWILTSEETVHETGNCLLARKLDCVRVVGIREPVRLYELLDMADSASSEQKKLVEVFHEALDLFEKRSWQQAANGFKEALAIKAEDSLSKIYLDRSENYTREPPADNWDGVYNLTEK